MSRKTLKRSLLDDSDEDEKDAQNQKSQSFLDSILKRCSARRNPPIKIESDTSGQEDDDKDVVVLIRQPKRSSRESIPSRRKRILKEKTSGAGKSTREQENEDQENEDDDDHEAITDPIDDPGVQRHLASVARQLQELHQRVQRCPLSQDPLSNLHTVAQEIEKLSKFQDRQERIVGLIGETGAGKSSVINSILGQRGLARSSGAGAACTNVPVEYRHLDDCHPHPYTIEADFMSEEELMELLEELLRSVRRAYLPTDRSLIGEEDWEQYEAIGKRSYETLGAIFKFREEVNLEYLVQPDKELEILEDLEQTARKFWSSQSGTQGSSKFSVAAKDLEQCKDELDRLASDSEDERKPASWPFIKLIRVFLDLPILKKGLVLTDLPGLRDINHARVRATEKYLARTCDEVFIVSGIARCVSNESIYDIIRKCGNGKHIRIVCTRADEISPEEEARGTSPFAAEIRNISINIRSLETDLCETTLSRQSAREHGRAKFAIREAMITDELHELQYKRQALIMKHRNESVTDELCTSIQQRVAYDAQSVHVFCVGNELYGNPPSWLTRQYRKLSGVRELQKYCQSIPAEARMISARSYVQHEVPALVHSLYQWKLTGCDSVGAEKATKLQVVFDQAESSLREKFESPSGLLTNLRNEALPTFEALVLKDLRHSFESIMGDKFLEVGDQWQQESRNPHHKKKRIRLLERSVDGANKRHVAPKAIDNLLVALSHRENNMQQALRKGLSRFDKNIQLAKQHLLYGHNHSSLIGDLMRQTYNKCSREAGQCPHINGAKAEEEDQVKYSVSPDSFHRDAGVKSDQRRKNAMIDHLSDAGLYLKYIESTRSFYEETVKSSVAVIEKSLRDQISLIVGDFASVMMSSKEDPEPEREPKLTRDLSPRLRDLQKSLKCTAESLKKVHN
ncbi:hypothetical protein POX_a01079 [Penicillium oxalicum]|uniref:hypothetical protein n=1 Tax=Penicillium oxalicum TaxID=69781 RepID=UPI0020B7454B|nr:hypothetical protein POX_a01079 [Penicillium oxalicum]KAI2794480.1 hypothetical protein POX_a01079 [Penicillium oxalicum]